MFTKKNLSLIIGLVLIVCVAVYINWRYAGADTAANTDSERESYGEAEFVNSSGGTYFEQARLTRKTTRDDAVEQLQQIVDNPNATQESKEKAISTMADYARFTETEGRIENLIKAKGFDECVVFIGIDSVSVVVKTEGLSDTDAAKITDIVVREAKIPASKLNIIEIK